jgi:murein DD-endopeptidase MepM/ murein hydrolase activator NlpD
MSDSVADRLKRVDAGFLVWLEGKEERLPRIRRVHEIGGETFAAAIRACAWLAQHFSNPKLISRGTPKEWLGRYRVLEQFLWSALRFSMVGADTAKDLEALESLLGELLPQANWNQYRQDIQDLRKQGQPIRLPKSRAKRSGGRAVAERTLRMCAAVDYISSFGSSDPYRDLAEFWNEHLKYEKYSRAEILNTLSKRCKDKGRGFQLVRFWQDIYRGDLRAVFPGPFPVSELFGTRKHPSKQQMVEIKKAYDRWVESMKEAFGPDECAWPTSAWKR